MNEFHLFGQEHILAICLGISVIIALIYIAKFVDDKVKFAKIISIIVILTKISELIYRYTLGEPIREMLPLHLCNISLMITAAMLFTKSKYLFQLTYFWFPTSIIPLITPELYTPMWNLISISFFVSHFFLVFGAFYAFIYYKLFPSFKGFNQAFLTLNGIALIVYHINGKLGTNYLYINYLPTFTSPLMLLGPWPIYIIYVELIYLSLSYLIYLPFKNHKAVSIDLEAEFKK